MDGKGDQDVIAAERTDPEVERAYLRIYPSTTNLDEPKYVLNTRGKRDWASEAGASVVVPIGINSTFENIPLLGPPDPWFYIPKRFILVFIALLGFANVYGMCGVLWCVEVCCAHLVVALRVVLSVAIVPMQKQYGWSNAEKGYLLSSFFVGYIITQVLVLHNPPHPQHTLSHTPLGNDVGRSRV